MVKNILKKFCTITSTKDDAVNSFHCTYIYSGTVYYDIALCPPLKAGQFENQRIFKLLRLYSSFTHDRSEILHSRKKVTKKSK